MVLSETYPGHARYVRKLVTVRIPNLSDVVR
jgi:hypothetical protein